MPVNSGLFTVLKQQDQVFQASYAVLHRLKERINIQAVPGENGAPGIAQVQGLPHMRPEQLEHVRRNLLHTLLVVTEQHVQVRFVLLELLFLRKELSSRGRQVDV